jgi:hypothetical protein
MTPKAITLLVCGNRLGMPTPLGRYLGMNSASLSRPLMNCAVEIWPTFSAAKPY